MKLTNATALITGGSSGIGRAIAKILVEAGAKVAITGRHRDRLVAAEQELARISHQPSSDPHSAAKAKG
ncbi:MAG: SDR family NAD(P)-dependent oxidoreductase [Acidobacteria bacterium]|nr:SDR family NAD(P)-dependent oxidoreductase [Acidobacteriota bacterium]